MSLSTPQDLLAEALRRCASEQIHLVGSIQGHGILLAIDAVGVVRMASNNLQAVVTRQRHEKTNHLMPMDSGLKNRSDFSDSRLTSGWVQDSFLTPLDSRSAPLGS